MVEIEICKPEPLFPVNIRDWSENSHEQVIVPGTIEPFETMVLAALKNFLDVSLSDAASLEFEIRELTHNSHQLKAYRLMACAKSGAISIDTTNQIRALNQSFFNMISTGQSDCFNDDHACDLSAAEPHKSTNHEESKQIVETFKGRHHKKKMKSLVFSLMENEKIDIAHIRPPEAKRSKNELTENDQLTVAGYRTSTQEIFCKNKNSEEIILSAKDDPAAAIILNVISRKEELRKAVLLSSQGKAGKKSYACIKSAEFFHGEQQPIKL